MQETTSSRLHKKLTIFWIARPRITFCRKIKASSSSSSNWKTISPRSLYGKFNIFCITYNQDHNESLRVRCSSCQKTRMVKSWHKRCAFFTWDGTCTDGVGGRGIGFSTFTKNLSGFSGSGGLLANSITFATSSNSLWRRCFLFTNPPFPLDLGFGAWILGCVTKSGSEASSSSRPW